MRQPDFVQIVVSFWMGNRKPSLILRGGLLHVDIFVIGRALVLGAVFTSSHKQGIVLKIRHEINCKLYINYKGK